MTLIAVVMGSPTRDIRNAEASKMLDYGFANYALYRLEKEDMGEIKVLGGTAQSCKILHGELSAVVESAKKGSIEIVTELPESVAAPIKSGDTVGTIRIMSGDTEIGKTDIVADEDVGKISYFGVFGQIFRYFCLIR